MMTPRREHVQAAAIVRVADFFQRAATRDAELLQALRIRTAA
ncbi:hypothetical protein ACFYMW_34030 [Streptomyces sp. NPDC006692]